MSRQKLTVYIVHQFATAGIDCFDDLISPKDHRILGVYLEKEMAHNHRDKVITLNGPYVAVTKHKVRGKASQLLSWFNHPEYIIQTKENSIVYHQIKERT